MKTLFVALLAAGLFVSAHGADAATQCRDAKGKFIKCPPAAAAAPAPKPAQCRDAKGKFIKCPATPAVPAKPKQCRDAKGKFIKCPA